MSGEPLAEKFAIAIVPVAVPEAATIGLPNVEIHGATVVAATAIDPGRTGDYFPLPGIAEEVAAVREAFPQTRLIEGADATARTIERSVAGVDALHFAGHAEAGADTVRLLVAPDPAVSDAALTLGLWRPRLAGAGVQLAVLSACSTARRQKTAKVVTKVVTPVLNYLWVSINRD